MPLTWSIDKEARLVTIEGRGVVDRPFLESYLQAMNAHGCKGYCKLFDLMSAAFDIGSDDIDAVAGELQDFGADGTAGPVAMVVDHVMPLTLDMAVLLKQRMGVNRPVQIFFTTEEALQWFENVRALKFIPVAAAKLVGGIGGSGTGASAESTAKAAAEGGASILVVDDEPDGRDTAAEHLAVLGYRVLKASTGAEALELLTNGNPVDLLFTDVVMGGMTGQQLADIAVRLNPRLKVLFTSGYIGTALTSGGTLKPGTKVLVKPFRRRELAQATEEALKLGR